MSQYLSRFGHSYSKFTLTETSNHRNLVDAAETSLAEHGAVNHVAVNKDIMTGILLAQTSRNRRTSVFIQT